MGQVELKNKDEIALMRDAGRIVSEILDALQTAVAPGITTWDLDGIAEDLIFRKGAKPAFKGYLGFPCCLCASVNQEVIHGIPSKKKKLAEGDLIKLDFGVVYRGFYGDSARTLPVGRISDEAVRLIEATRESLHQVEVLDDEWTAVTLDGRLSAHFEHTVLVSEDGPEILTRLTAGSVAST